jgi:hypothetical protein
VINPKFLEAIDQYRHEDTALEVTEEEFDVLKRTYPNALDEETTANMKNSGILGYLYGIVLVTDRYAKHFLWRQAVRVPPLMEESK